MNVDDYLTQYPTITQESERLFVREFLFPVLGDNLAKIEPQRPFIDRSGSSRRIDFAFVDERSRLALEVNGETYHAEGIIPNEMFDDNLFRQNEILAAKFNLIRFSYTQLQAVKWRPLVMETLREFFSTNAPHLLKPNSLYPNFAQQQALDALAFYRDSRGYDSGLVILPTGTGKTVLSAMDAFRVGGRILFVVHRLDILRQSAAAFLSVKPTAKIGMLIGNVRENLYDSDVLLASKDSLRDSEMLRSFSPNAFDYVIIDEVHHGQSPTYKEIISFFKPKFMMGMTATPDRADRQSILELFNYRKIYELELSEAIERGLLVPYNYIGLTDNVDYSRIRFQGNKYRVDDLERYLIIPERNAAILKAYLQQGGRNKAIGFCVSISHSERMAAYFQDEGVTAFAIHSKSIDRDDLLKKFRANEIEILFTVDLFNEGIDIPNVQTLLFLRPTESKTVFLQQLGRGLRMCSGKERVTVLDFIGNYKRANQIRKYLAKKVSTEESIDNGRTKKKTVYTYAVGCAVVFDSSVEEIMARQDAADLPVEPDDLKEAYFILAEKLGRKPAKSDLDSDGEFKANRYISAFGTWRKFLQAVGEYTESSYAYPQGVHLGHLLAVLWYFSENRRACSPFADRYIRLRGGLDQARLGIYQRQIKYKLQAAMEFGIISDDRKFSSEEENPFALTALGKSMYDELKPLLSSLDLNFPLGAGGVPSTQMKKSDAFYSEALRDYIKTRAKARLIVRKCFLGVNAVQQMLRFIYQVCRRARINRQEIYDQFDKAPFVSQYCEQEGIDIPSSEAARHRYPFLLTILATLDCVELSRSEVSVHTLLLTSELVRSSRDDDRKALLGRLIAVKAGWPHASEKIADADLTALRELYGRSFLTEQYEIKQLSIYEEVNG